MTKIQLFSGGNLQRQFPLHQECEIRVGRSTHCDIIIQNADVSRHHCTFRHSQGQWMVVDADSANGTFVNGESIKERVLRHSDKVSVGQYSLLFDLYGTLPAAAPTDPYSEDEGTGKPSTVLLYRDELLTLLESSQKSQSMALVLAATDRVVVPLVKEITSIGNDWECDLRIGGLFIKPRQALVVKSGEGHAIIHQGGPREIYLNGRKLKQQQTPLKPEDVLEIAGNKIFYGSL